MLSCDMSCQERKYVKYVCKKKVENTFSQCKKKKKNCFEKKQTTRLQCYEAKIMNSIVQDIHPADVCKLKVHIFSLLFHFNIYSLWVSLKSLSRAALFSLLSKQFMLHLQDSIIITILLMISPFLHRKRTADVWVR